MKNHNKPLILATILEISIVSMAQAGTLSVINKTSDPIQLFFRGEGSDSHSKKLIGAGQQKDLIVERENISGKPTFEVIASTSTSGDPDWKLLGGKCKELVADSDHTIVIESTLGKISCKNVSAENPGKTD